ncbi:MAG: hypothetical protein JXR07_20535 [Reichenbachiella sp.]
MRTLIFLIALIPFITNCGSNFDKESLSAGDSLFVDDGLILRIASRVHKTNDNGFVDGHADVDSSKMVMVSSFGRKFFFEREKTFVGTFKEVCAYDPNYIIVDLEKDIIKATLKTDKVSFNYLGKKIKVDKKKFYSGEISKGVVLENFPNEVYVKISNLNISSADSVFAVLK